MELGPTTKPKEFRQQGFPKTSESEKTMALQSSYVLCCCKSGVNGSSIQTIIKKKMVVQR
eukprot:12430166-Karenia_brevis.AAC.1